MADKTIDQLTLATVIQDNDLFVLQQGGVAKKLLGSALKQYISMVEVNSIESVTFDAQHRCVITLTDGTVITSQSLHGADAPTITNIAIDANYHLIVTLSNGTSYDAGYCRGASGAGTGDMLASIYDASAPAGGRVTPKQVAFAADITAKTETMTQAVGIDSNGALWTSPSPSSNVISFSCGDGVNVETTRASNYYWLDTGATLDIPIEDYFIEIIVFGFGRVGTSGSVSADIIFSFSTGQEELEFYVPNIQNISQTSDFRWQSKTINAIVSGKMRKLTMNSYGSSNTTFENTVSTTNLTGARINRLRVIAENDDSNLQTCVIRFTKKTT